MHEDCRDCIQIKNIENRIKDIWCQVEESKEYRRELEKRVTDLEINRAETKEKLDRIFNAIDSIEKNIEKIASSIESIKTGGSRTYENLKYEIIKYIIIAALGLAFVKITK